MEINSTSFEVTPLAWTEFYFGDDLRSLKSKKEFLSYLKEFENKNEWHQKIDVSKLESQPERIQSLLIGYTLLDIADQLNAFDYAKYKMWRLFEDLVYEIFREALREKDECTIIRVDRIPGYQYLDFIILNNEKADWNVGIQCKRYIKTTIPHKYYQDYKSYSRNLSTGKLIESSKNLKAKHPNKRFVLATFNVYYSNKIQENRFNNLKEKSKWDKILVFNEPQNAHESYCLNCNGLKHVIKWC